MLLIAVLLQLSATQAYAQVVDTENTVSVPSNGMAGGANPSIWKARCKPGMVMTGIEIVVGGTCRNECNADGRPLAAYRILCSPLKTGDQINMQRSEN
jgi:hypothetical protein